jgi:hypothetical protein
MSSSKNEAISMAKEFVGLLKTNGIDVHEAYVFGSVAMDRD